MQSSSIVYPPIRSGQKKTLQNLCLQNIEYAERASSANKTLIVKQNCIVSKNDRNYKLALIIRLEI